MLLLRCFQRIRPDNTANREQIRLHRALQSSTAYGHLQCGWYQRLVENMKQLCVTSVTTAVIECREMAIG